MGIREGGHYRLREDPAEPSAEMITWGHLPIRGDF